MKQLFKNPFKLKKPTFMPSTKSRLLKHPQIKTQAKGQTGRFSQTLAPYSPLTTGPAPVPGNQGNRGKHALSPADVHIKMMKKRRGK
jgi:hypothetical protein